MLWMVQRVFFGPQTPSAASLRDITLREGLTVAPFVVMILVMGLRPQPFLDRLAPSSQRFVNRAQLGARAHASDDAVRIPMMELPAATAERMLAPRNPAHPGAAVRTLSAKSPETALP
jgi:NADH-quinone oxidoreductase subunit M